MVISSIIGVNPGQAIRNALRLVAARDSEAPLLDAASLVLSAARMADPSDPAWSDFLARLNAAEVSTIENAQASSGLCQLVSPLLLPHGNQHGG